jgi:hypothetical protein
MKYVKLFESWIQSVNEGIDANKIQTIKFDLGFNYDKEESYAKSSDGLAKHIAKLVNKAFSGKDRDYGTTITPKALNKKITLSASSGDEDLSTFTFDFDKATFEVEDNNILAIEGAGNIHAGAFQKSTSLAQFIYSVIAGQKLEPLSDEEMNNSMDELLYIAKNDKLASSKVQSKKSIREIAKMTIANFIELPEDKRIKLIERVIGSDYVVSQNGERATQFVIRIKPDVRKQKDIKVDPNDDKLVLQLEMPFGPDSIQGGSKLTDKQIEELYNENVKKLKNELGKSIANMVTFWGPMPNDTKDISGPTTTTFATITLALKDIAKNGFKTPDNVAIKNTNDFFGAIKADNDKSKTSKAEDAWKGISDKLDEA